MEALNKEVYPLHVAVLKWDTDTVIQILQKDSSTINSRYSNHNYTPLMLSVMDPRLTFTGLLSQNPQDPYPVKLVKCLLSHGACVNDFDDKGCTPLHMAMWAAGCEVVKVLLEAGAEVNAKDGDRCTPLHHLKYSVWANKDGPMEAKIAKLLLQNGANAFAPDHFTVTPIEDTLFRSSINLDLIQAYLDCGVDLNDSRLNYDDGSTLLHMCAMSSVSDSKSALALLIDRGFSVNVTNVRGETPLHMAAQRDRSSLSVMTMCDLGADAAIVDHLKRSPLHYFPMTFKEPYLVIQNLKCLLKSGADINAQDVFGCTPLHYALMFQEKPAMIKHLIQEGASMSLRDTHQKTALHYASENKRLQALQFFLERSSQGDLNSTDKYGSSPLHYAVLANSSDLVSLLLKAGVDVDVKDTQGRTAQDIAKMWCYTDIWKLLVQSNIQDQADHKSATIALAISSRKLLLDSALIDLDIFEGIPRPENLQQFCDNILDSPLFLLWSERGTYQMHETKAVTKEVTSFIQHLSNMCKEIDPMLCFTPKLRGSVAENTKYGPPNEFDFMLVMDGFKDTCEIESQDDYSRIIYNGKDDNLIPQKLPYAIKQGKILDFEIVGLRLFGIIKDVISCEQAWYNTELQLSQQVSLKNVSICLSIRWTGVYFKALEIDLDLVPCIPICNYDPSYFASLWPVGLDFSGCSAYCLLAHCSYDNEHYRETFKYELSTTEFEQVILESLPDNVLKGYVLAKAIRSPLISHTVEEFEVFIVKQSLSKSILENMKHKSADECVSSYLLKNALLKEVKQHILSGEMENESKPLSYVSWTRRIYSNLLASLQCNKVDSFFKRVNLMFGERKFSAAMNGSHQSDKWKSGLTNDSLNGSEEVKGLREALEKDYKQCYHNVEEDEGMVPIVHDAKVFVKVINYILNEDT